MTDPTAGLLREAIHARNLDAVYPWCEHQDDPPYRSCEAEAAALLARFALAATPAADAVAGLDDEDVARWFHEAYERLAPSFGYETRKASAVPWESVPEPNRSLMIAVAGEVRAKLTTSRLSE